MLALRQKISSARLRFWTTDQEHSINGDVTELTLVSSWGYLNGSSD